RGFRGAGAPEAPPRGAVLDWYFGRAPGGEVTLTIADSAGRVLRRFTNDTARDGEREGAGPGAGDAGRGVGVAPRWEADTALAGAGAHRFAWDLRWPAPRLVDDAVVYYGYAGGAPATPGTYRATLSAGGWSETRSFRVREDPRIDAGREDLEAQTALLRKIAGRIEEIHDAIRKARDVRSQVRAALARAEDLADRPPGVDSVRALGRALSDSLTAVEHALIQTKTRSGQDPINFEAKLWSYYAHLAGTVVSADAAPTAGERRRLTDLEADWSAVRERLERALGEPVDAFDRALETGGVPAVVVPPDHSRHPADTEAP
ncbi:MAG TPA: hypothetical protein VKB18_02990, partial [Gemmatimonadota bacterium]|nr:hypothetical protein [Gemmatimonadota bacterium]